MVGDVREIVIVQRNLKKNVQDVVSVGNILEDQGDAQEREDQGGAQEREDQGDAQERDGQGDAEESVLKIGQGLTSNDWFLPNFHSCLVNLISCDPRCHRQGGILHGGRGDDEYPAAAGYEGFIAREQLSCAVLDIALGEKRA